MRLPARATTVSALCLLALLPAACSGTPGRPTATSSPRTTASPATSTSPSSSPVTTPSADPTQTAVDAALARMDQRARVAQLFVVGVPLNGLAAGDALARSGVGGIFLAGRSTASTRELAEITSRWAGEAPGPRPWVACDQEGGLVQTLKGPGFALLPSALEQGRLPASQLAALRAAAAVLAARTHPEPGHRRPRSAWVLLEQVAPELGEWAAFFAAGAAKRAAAEAGLSRAVTDREADDLVRDVSAFLVVVEQSLVGPPPRPRPRVVDGSRNGR
jgi:hypothetical protein